MITDWVKQLYEGGTSEGAKKGWETRKGGGGGGNLKDQLKSAAVGRHSDQDFATVYADRENEDYGDADHEVAVSDVENEETEPTGETAIYYEVEASYQASRALNAKTKSERAIAVKRFKIAQKLATKAQQLNDAWNTSSHPETDAP